MTVLFSTRWLPAVRDIGEPDLFSFSFGFFARYFCEAEAKRGIRVFGARVTLPGGRISTHFDYAPANRLLQGNPLGWGRFVQSCLRYDCFSLFFYLATILIYVVKT